MVDFKVLAVICMMIDAFSYFHIKNIGIKKRDPS